jgi:hypothetical protein
MKNVKKNERDDNKRESEGDDISDKKIYNFGQNLY